MVSSVVRGHTSFVRTALEQSHAPFLRTGPPWTPPPQNPLWMPHDAISFKPCHYLDSFILWGLSPLTRSSLLWSQPHTSSHYSPCPLLSGTLGGF